jgi:hypothetical protein
MRVLYRLAKSRGVGCNGDADGSLLGIKAWVGLGRFVLQSYEKSELEVEPGSTEHAARCKVPSHQKHRRQSSRKLLYTEAKAKVSLFVP